VRSADLEVLEAAEGGLGLGILAEVTALRHGVELNLAIPARAGSMVCA
jgi:hypothetical protein